jgi:TolB protein
MDELLPVEPVRPPSPARRRLLVAVTVIVLAAFVVVAGLEGSGFIVRSVPPPTAEPSQAPIAPARLAFVDLDGGLGVMDAGGASVIHVPAAGGTFQFPAWSPDASRVAAIRTDADGTSLDVFALPATADTPGGPPDRTTVYSSALAPVFYLYWSPDSRALAFLTNEPDGIALRRAPIDAGGATTVVRRGSPMYWQWVDAARLLVHSGSDASDAFAGEVGLDGAIAGSSPLETGAFRAPALSSDGRFVAFGNETAGGGMSVVVEARDASARHDIPVQGTAAFAFDPAGDTLAFVAAAGPGAAADLPVGPLRAVDATTGAVRTLLDGSVVTFFWAPDGRTIAAVGVPVPGDTKVASAHGAPVTLARAETQGFGAADGVALRLTFIDAATASIRSVHDIQLADLFINQVLPFFDQYALSHRFWSPDSRSIVLPVVGDQGTSRITTFFADGSDPLELVDGLFASWSP